MQARFWAFSLSVYRNAAVQMECLDLQERYDVDVNLLLFCAFVGTVHCAILSDSEVRQAAEIVDEWHKNVVRSLRHARRTLKPFATNPSAIGAPSATLRTSVKTMELEAERIEQAMLEDWSASRVTAWPRTEPAEAVVANIQALFGIRDRSAERADLPKHLVAAALAIASQELSASPKA